MRPLQISRGPDHARAIKSSPRWAEYQTKLRGAPYSWNAAEDAEARRLAEESANAARHWLALARRRERAALGKQLFDAYRHGYIAALQEVKRERLRQEAASYAEATPSITKQEFYELRHTA